MEIRENASRANIFRQISSGKMSSGDLWAILLEKCLPGKCKKIVTAFRAEFLSFSVSFEYFPAKKIGIWRKFHASHAKRAES
jgi:hypothetical protein